MTLSRRDRQFEVTQQEIKQIARTHMAAEGTAALSLRAIARDMGMTAPALYRYYPDRDALITALIVDAYNALAQAIHDATTTPPVEAYAKQLYAALMCYRDWALAHRIEFQLIFGNPIPDYVAPAEQTTPAARSVGSVIMQILRDAYIAGVLQIPAEHREVPPLTHAMVLDLAADCAPEARHGLAYLYLVGWMKIHGMIVLEMFNHTTPMLPDTGAFYRYEILSYLHEIGLYPEET
jgi:AcrR family transcriptional regulator